MDLLSLTLVLLSLLLSISLLLYKRWQEAVQRRTAEYGLPWVTSPKATGKEDPPTNVDGPRHSRRGNGKRKEGQVLMPRNYYRCE
jgi:hypothetical protein